MPAWTPEEDEILHKLKPKGKSGSEIAFFLPGRTRNAVIGRMHRLGIATGHNSARLSAHMKRRNKKDKSKKPRNFELRPESRPYKKKPFLAIVEPLPEPAATDIARKPLVDLQDGDCRWPCGDPKTVGFGFCADPKVPGLPYCSEHAVRAFRPPHPVSRAPEIVSPAPVEPSRVAEKVEA